MEERELWAGYYVRYLSQMGFTAAPKQQAKARRGYFELEVEDLLLHLRGRVGLDGGAT